MDQPEPNDPPRRPDHGCFGCGELNPCGLHLVFERADGGVRARFTPRPQDEGFFGVVHGGIVSTLLDEAMAWAAFAQGIWAVTGKLDVRFRRPVQVVVEVIVSGRVLANRGRVLDAAGTIHQAEDGGLLAEGTGLFVRVPESQAREWGRRYLDAPDG